MKITVAELKKDIPKLCKGMDREQAKQKIERAYSDHLGENPDFEQNLKQALDEQFGVQKATALVKSEQSAPQETATASPGPLTEKEAIQVVQGWVAEDADVDVSERRTFDEMVENLEAIDTHRAAKSIVSTPRLKEIVRTHAPNAPSHADAPSLAKPDVPPYPSELTPLIESGVAYHEEDHWWVHRCRKCSKFALTCCGEITSESAVRHGEKTLTSYGRQAVGLDPIKPPKSQEQIEKETAERIKDASWMLQFRGVDELEGNGTVKMYIEEFLPEGTTLFCGLPKEGKSFLALSVAKALTSGRPLFGNPRFSVPDIVPVLYLAAESGDGALKLRCEKFGITKRQNEVYRSNVDARADVRAGRSEH